MSSLRQRKILSAGELGLIFFNIEVVQERQSAFLSALSELNTDVQDSSQQLVLALAKFQEFFVLHAQFSSNYSSAVALAARMLRESENLARFSVDLASNPASKPWFGILACLNVPIRYILQFWMLLSKIVTLLPKPDAEKCSAATSAIKDSVDQIKIHPLLEQSTWPLVEMVRNFDRLDEVWIFKPYRSFITRKPVSLFGGSFEVMCYILSDSYVFVSAHKFLGKLRISECSVLKAPAAQQLVEDKTSNPTFWLRIEIAASEYILISVQSETERLDWIDRHLRLQAALRAPFFRSLKVDGKLSQAPYSTCTQLSRDECVVVGANGANTIDVLDLARNTSSTRPISKLKSLMDHSCVADESRLLLFGGIDNGVVSGSLWQVTLDSLRCHELVTNGESPAARAGHSSTVVGRSVFLFGGATKRKKATVFLNDFWEFDLDQQNWKRISADEEPPTGRAHHASAAYGKKIYIFGGECEGTSLSDLASFDVEARTWKTESPSGVGPTPRHSCASTSFGNYLILHGGRNADVIYEDIFLLDLASLVWIRLDFPTSLKRRFATYIHLIGAPTPVSTDFGPVADLTNASLILPEPEDSSVSVLPLSPVWWITPQNVDARLKEKSAAKSRRDAKNKRLSPYVHSGVEASSHHYYRSSASKTAKFNTIQQALAEKIEKDPPAASGGSQLEAALLNQLPTVFAHILRKASAPAIVQDLSDSECKIFTARGNASSNLHVEDDLLVVQASNFTFKFDIFNHGCVVDPATTDLTLLPAASPVAAVRLRFSSAQSRSRFANEYSSLRRRHIADSLSNGTMFSIPCSPYAFTRVVRLFSI